MDINLPGLDVVEYVRRLKAQMPATVFVMLTVFENTERIFQAIQAGPAATCSNPAIQPRCSKPSGMPAVAERS